MGCVNMCWVCRLRSHLEQEAVRRFEVPCVGWLGKSKHDALALVWIERGAVCCQRGAQRGTLRDGESQHCTASNTEFGRLHTVSQLVTSCSRESLKQTSTFKARTHLRQDVPQLKVFFGEAIKQGCCTSVLLRMHPCKLVALAFWRCAFGFVCSSTTSRTRTSKGVGNRGQHAARGRRRWWR